MSQDRQHFEKINLEKYLHALRNKNLIEFLKIFKYFQVLSLAEKNKIETIADALIETGFKEEDSMQLQRIMALLAHLKIPHSFNKNINKQEYHSYLLLEELYKILLNRFKVNNDEYEKTKKEIEKNPTISTTVLTPKTIRRLQINSVDILASKEVAENKRKSFHAILGSSKQPIEEDSDSDDEKEDADFKQKALPVIAKPNLPLNINHSNKKFIIAGAVILAFVTAATIAAIILTGPGAAILTPIFLMVGNAVLTTLGISAGAGTIYTVGAILTSIAVVAVASAMGAVMGYLIGKVYHQNKTPKKSLPKIEAPDPKDSDPPPPQISRGSKPEAGIKKQPPETEPKIIPHDNKATQPSTNRAALYGYGPPINTEPQQQPQQQQQYEYK